MTKVEKISQEIMGCVLSAEELDNLLAAEGFYPLENDSDDEVIRYTNYKYQIWIGGERDEEGNVPGNGSNSCNKIGGTDEG